MSALITLIVSGLYLILIKYVYRAFLAFIFSVPFLPRFIGVGVGEEGFALSLQRVLVFLLFVAVSLVLVQNSAKLKDHVSMGYKVGRSLFFGVILFLFVKLISLSLNGPSVSMFFGLFNDFLFSLFVFFAVVLFVRSEQAINDVMKCLAFSYMAVLLLVSIESIFKTPVLSVFYSDSIAVHRDISAGFSRDGQYRTVGGFSNPMALGEFLVVLLPLTVAYIGRKKSILLLPFLILSAYAIYTTGSRAAVLMSLLLVYLFCYIRIYKKGGYIRFLLNIFNLFVVFLGIYLIYQLVGSMIAGFSGNYLEYDIEVRSFYSRAVQYSYVLSLLVQSPITGFGRVRNFTEAFDEKFAIDNHFLWVVLEVGLLGLAVYFLMYYFFIKMAYRNVKSGVDFSISLFLASVGITLYHFFVAIPDVHIYIYIFAGLMVSSRVVQGKKARYI